MSSEPKKLWVALLVTLLASMGISLPYPVLTPLFIDASISALNSWNGFSSTTLFTAIIAIYPLGIFIGSSFIGALSDRYGRKRVLAQTLLICFVGYLVSAYALVIENYPLLLISRFLTGITEGNISIARAIALDIGESSDEKQGMTKVRAVSLINSAVFLGWLIGPLVGGILADMMPYFAMLAAAVGALVCLLLVQIWLQETLNNIKVKENRSIWHSVIKENSLQLIRDPWVARLFTMYLLYTLAINLFYEFYPVWLVDKQDYGSLGIGLATTNMTVFMTLTSIFIVTRVQRRFGLILPMTNIMWLLAIAMVLVPYSFGLSTHILFAITGIVIAIFNGLLPVYLSERQQNKGNGAIMGLMTMTFCIANVFAALIGGALLEFSSELPMFVSSVFFLMGLLLFYLWFAKPERLVRTSDTLQKSSD